MQGFSNFNPTTTDRLKSVLENEVNKLLEPYNVKLSVEGCSYYPNEANLRVKANILKTTSGAPVLTKEEDAFEAFAKSNMFRYGLHQEFDVPKSLVRQFKGMTRIKFTGYNGRQRKFKVFIMDVVKGKVWRITTQMALDLNDAVCKENV